MGLLLKILLGITSAINLSNRNQAAATMEEPIETPEQLTGRVIQDFSNRGIMIGPNSPAVVEAQRRASLVKRQQQAQTTLAQPSPWETLFGVFTSK